MSSSTMAEALVSVWVLVRGSTGAVAEVLASTRIVPKASEQVGVAVEVLASAIRMLALTWVSTVAANNG